MPTYGETPSTIHTPHHATRPATHVYICLLRGGRAKLLHCRIEIEATSISDADEALPSVAMVQIGIRLSYVMHLGGGVLADTRVARVAWCGVWRVEGVSP